MRRTWISAAAATAIGLVSGGHPWAQVSAGSGEAAGQNQAPATQETQNNRNPPPGAEGMDRTAQRAHTAAPIDQMTQGQKPADRSDLK